MAEELTDEEIEKRATVFVKERDANLRNGGKRACFGVKHGMRNKVLPCEICGAPVMQGGGLVRFRCARCGKIYNKIYKRLSVTRTRAYARRKAEREAAHLPPVEPPKPAPKPPVGQCKYCGQVNVVNKYGYCRECVAEGLDRLHAATGRTNGWDAKPRQKVLVKDGWRGRPCAGGKSHDFDQFRVALGVPPVASASTPSELARRRERALALRKQRKEEEQNRQNKETQECQLDSQSPSKGRENEKEN